MAKFTLQEFRKQYPSDAACLDKIFQMRYGNITRCPHCKQETTFRRVTTRRCYQCRKCYEQFYPTAGTIFEKTRVPLSDWFYIIFLFSTTRNGVSAKEIERLLGVTYKCAFRMGHQIRKLFETIPQDKLKGFVEFDESWVGGSQANAVSRQVPPQKMVFGLVERLGSVRAFHVKNIKAESLIPLIQSHVDKQSWVYSDENPTYVQLEKLGFDKHQRIAHSRKEYVVRDISTNTIEGYFSQLKRMIKGTHIQVSEKYFQNYINESCFRYNLRHAPFQMFNIIVDRISEQGNSVE